MPDERRLVQAIDFILNHADDDELAVIVAALKRRSEAYAQGSPKSMADSMARNISDQVSYSVDGIRDMVRGFVSDMIRKEAPDIPDEHVDALLKEWVPKPGERKAERQPELPKDVLLTMIRQFLEYSSESMSPTERVKLEEEIPGWQETYWARFPEAVRRLLADYLEGRIDAERCWTDIHRLLDT